MRRLAVVLALVLVLAAVAGVADHVSLHRQLDRDRAQQRALRSRVTAIETGSGSTNDALRADLTSLSVRMGKVEDAARPVCNASDLKAERARIDGQNAGSGYASTTYFSTLLELLTTVCGPAAS